MSQKSRQNSLSSAEKVYRIVRLIPEGKVLTYGRLARRAGVKNPRVVGNILHRNSDPKHIPCHRVVNSLGRVSPKYAYGGADMQIRKLRKEGVTFRKNLVDLSLCLWYPIRTPDDVL